MPHVEEGRRAYRTARALQKKQIDDPADGRFKASKEELKKMQKKPDSGPNPRK